jgi:hypothetical protein
MNDIPADRVTKLHGLGVAEFRGGQVLDRVNLVSALKAASREIIARSDSLFTRTDRSLPCNQTFTAISVANGRVVQVRRSEPTKSFRPSGTRLFGLNLWSVRYKFNLTRFWVQHWVQLNEERMAFPVRKRRQISHFTVLNQTVAAISKATAFSIFGPFRPTTDLSDASSKPKP